MTVGDLLADRYRIECELGRGGAGITYLVNDMKDRSKAVAKLLHLDLLSDWKAVELFEREAAVLKALHHKRIPAYKDFFRADVEGTARFVLVREFVEGKNLQEKVDTDWRATEKEVCDLGARLLSVVDYIHSVRPPVIHRDINPRNIIQRDDQEVFLLDFGGVQDAIRVSRAASSTIVGTPGYTPLEQFTGRATVRSDLYAVAATLLFILTHRNPADLPTRNMKIDFRSVVEISSPGLTRVLGNWLEPDEARRTLSVSDAAALLRGEKIAPARADVRTMPPSLPYGSRMRLEERDDWLRIEIPEREGRRSAFGGFGIFWLGMVGLWTYSASSAGAPIGFQLFSLPFWIVGVLIVFRSLFSLFGKVGITIEADGVTFARRFLFFRRQTKAPLADVGQCLVQEGRSYYTHSHYEREYKARSHLLMDLGARTVRFGTSLSTREQEWMRERINAEVRRLTE
jgi:eukaryotic-like serine/threonine-protein kinase